MEFTPEEIARMRNIIGPSETAYDKKFLAALDTIAQQQAEIGRLREALIAIKAQTASYHPEDRSYDIIYDLAYEALKGGAG